MRVRYFIPTTIVSIVYFIWSACNSMGDIGIVPESIVDNVSELYANSVFVDCFKIYS